MSRISTVPLCQHIIWYLLSIQLYYFRVWEFVSGTCSNSQKYICVIIVHKGISVRVPVVWFRMSGLWYLVYGMYDTSIRTWIIIFVCQFKCLQFNMLCLKESCKHSTFPLKQSPLTFAWIHALFSTETRHDKGSPCVCAKVKWSCRLCIQTWISRYKSASLSELSKVSVSTPHNLKALAS